MILSGKLPKPLTTRLASGLDSVLDRTVVPGFSLIGPAIRSRLPSWPADPAPGALAGRHVLVTGATSGIGTANAEQLAALGATVHLVVRDVDKGAQIAALIDGETRVWRCDIGDLDSVRDFAQALRDSDIAPFGVIHNAGVLPARRTESAQGHELTMAVHVLGPILMTDLLYEHLAPDARIVFVTSGGMYTQRLPVADPDYQVGEYAGATAYARSKRTQVDLLGHLARRWPRAGVYAMHPGWVATPGVSESLPLPGRLPPVPVAAPVPPPPGPVEVVAFSSSLQAARAIAKASERVSEVTTVFLMAIS